MTEITDLSPTDASNTSITGESLDGNVANMGRMDNTLQAILGMVARSIRTGEWRVLDNTDDTKELALDLSGLTTATTRTLTVPDRSGTIALKNDIDVRRNRVVNGDKSVSQENAQTSGTANGRYLSDQNAMYFVSSAGTFTGVNVLTLSPAGGYRDRITITVADASLAAGEYLTYSQNLEGSNVRDLMWGTANAVDAVARIGFKGPAGTYAYRLGNSAANRSYVALFTISGGEANTDVVREFAIPGDTTGTWLNTDGVIGITRDIVLACGSTFQGTTGWQAGNILGTSGVSNGMGTGAAVFEFFDEGFKADPDSTGVYGQYEVGETDAVYRPERYWEKSYAASVTPGAVSSLGSKTARAGITGTLFVSVSWTVRKCKAPTVTAYSSRTGASGTVNDATALADRASVVIDASQTGYQENATFSAGNAAQWQWTADARL